MAIDQIAAAGDAAGAKAPIPSFNDGDGPSFSDVLDILNPLQHIPIINSLYQHLTGDSEGAVADVAGGTLWAGPVGLIGSLLDLSLRADTGKSVSDTLLGWLGLGDDSSDSATAVAASQANNPANPASPAAATLQQTAAATLPPPVVVQTLPAPRSRPSSDRSADEKDRSGPLQMGDFLVFGATGSAQPRVMAAAPAPASPPSSGQAAAAPSRQGDYLVFGALPDATANPQTAGQSTPPAAGAAPQRQGGYLIFGGTPPAPAAAQPVQMASAAPAAPIPLTPSGRSYPVPERRNPVVPTTLPPPTTGPAALPGHGPSQAVTANNADDSWFVNALNTGLDKYQAAQKLSQNDLAVEAGATLH